MGFVETLLRSLSWKDIYDEHYGIEEYKQEEIQEEEIKPKKSGKKKGFSVEVEGNVYSSITEASRQTGINYDTLRDYLNRRRTPKVNCKKLYDEND